MTDKILSARFIMAVMFSLTTCVAYLKGLMNTEAFIALAGAVVAHYFNKTRLGENPLNDKPVSK